MLTDDLSSVGRFLLRPNAKVLGPRLGKAVQAVIGAAKAGEWTQLDDGTVSVAGETLAEGEFELALEPTEGRVAAPLRDNDAVVELDVEVTDELRDEGRARDVVRAVQQARKDAGLHVSDRIVLTLAMDDELARSIDAHRELDRRAGAGHLVVRPAARRATVTPRPTACGSRSTWHRLPDTAGLTPPG